MVRDTYERCGCGRGGKYSCPVCNPPPKPKPEKPVQPKCSCGCNQTAQNCPNR